MSVFTLEATDGSARAGLLQTGHGVVATPTFMPVATLGSVKAIDPEDLRSIGATIVLGNTYHLYLRPGVEVIRDLGGLHGFMAWRGPILTDSGGFQVFSLAHLRKLTEDAVIFKSHIDGSLHTFTPEAVVGYEEALGADVIMPLDVCLPSNEERRAVEEAVERTARWARRSLEAHRRGDQLLFGIVQGGLLRDLRERSVAVTTRLGFPGYAVGGLSVGESKEEMYEVTDYTAELLPQDAPRYLMGVGSPEDLVECVARGIDLFDCVLPTRIARNGALLVSTGRVNIVSAPFKNREAPIEEGCDCYTCRTFSAAYVHHLFRSKELLGYRLATLHNLRFVLRLMDDMREAIKAGAFAAFRRAFHELFVPTDQRAGREQKQRWVEAQRRKREGGEAV